MNRDVLGHGSKAYLPSFSVQYTGEKYAKGWERIFGKKNNKDKKEKKSNDSDGSQGNR